MKKILGRGISGLMVVFLLGAACACQQTYPEPVSGTALEALRAEYPRVEEDAQISMFSRIYQGGFRIFKPAHRRCHPFHYRRSHHGKHLFARHGGRPHVNVHYLLLPGAY